MPTFFCKIGTADGRVVEREFEASNRERLRENLEEQGFFVFNIRRRPWQNFLPLGIGPSRFSGRRFLVFNQEFLVLIRSGLPILQVLDALVERMESGGILNALQEIRQDIKGGSSLSEAFGKFPRFFPHLFLASIRAGERTGDLPNTLGRYIAYQKRMEAIRRKVQSASIYPIILCLAMTGVLLFMLVYVIPSFTQIYADAKVELPVLTRLVIWTAEGVKNTLPLALLIGIPVAMSGHRFLNTERGIFWRDRVKLRLPFFGPLATEYAIAGYCRTLATTLASGMPVVQAMRMSQGTLNNRILETRLSRAVQRVEEGIRIAEALGEAGFFPKIALRMIGVGEASGGLDDMLNDVSDFYEEEVEGRLDRLSTMIEPLMLLLAGLIIGGIVVAMYIPIFQLAGTASGNP